MFWIFVTGFVCLTVGAAAGLFAAALCFAASQDGNDEEEHF